MSNTNTKNQNIWDRNTGYKNTGNRNTGNRNTGDRNTGYKNTGNTNTGNRNTGNTNTGNRNIGNKNVGYLNTITPTKWYIFDKEYEWIYDIDFPSWFYFDVKTTERFNFDDMTQEQKEQYPLAESIWGYLHKYEVSDNLHKEWRESFDKADEEDVASTLELPNFNYEVFEKISWVTKEDFDRKLWKIQTMSWKKVKVIVDWKEYDAVIE